MPKNLAELTQQTPLQPLKHPLFDQQKIEVWLKREDLNHPLIQGNKLYKLALNLTKAQTLAANPIISFGGAYSNHISALAAAGKAMELKTLGVIRGAELAHQPERWSQTLLQAQQDGMQLEFLTRQAYRQKHEEIFLNALQTRFPKGYIIPEGGTNTLAIEGLKPLAQAIDQQCPDWTHLYCAVGTGGTLAGLIKHSHYHPNKQIIGVSTLAQNGYLVQQIEQWLSASSSDHLHYNHWRLDASSHFGGYGKQPKALTKVMQQFEHTFDLLLDPIYTAKMVAAFYQHLSEQSFKPESKIVLLHTGGLQGRT